jgi:hypothetical protein
MGSIPAGLFDVLGAGNAGFQSGAHTPIDTITVTAVYPGPRGSSPAAPYGANPFAGLPLGPTPHQLDQKTFSVYEQWVSGFLTGEWYVNGRGIPQNYQDSYDEVRFRGLVAVGLGRLPGGELEFINLWRRYGDWDLKFRKNWNGIQNDGKILDQIGNFVFGYTAAGFQQGRLGTVGAALSMATGVGLDALQRLAGVASYAESGGRWASSGRPWDAPGTGSCYGDKCQDPPFVASGYYAYGQDMLGNAWLAGP